MSPEAIGQPELPEDIRLAVWENGLYNALTGHCPPEYDSDAEVADVIETIHLWTGLSQETLEESKGLIAAEMRAAEMFFREAAEKKGIGC